MVSYKIRSQVDTNIQNETLNKMLEGMADHIKALKNGKEFMIIDENLKLSLTFKKSDLELILLKVQPSTSVSLSK